MLIWAATVVQGGQGAVDGHAVRQGRRATAGGTGQLAGVTPGAGSHHSAQPQNLGRRRR